MVEKSIEQLIKECKVDCMIEMNGVWQVGKFGYYSVKRKTLKEALKKLAELNVNTN